MKNRIRFTAFILVSVALAASLASAQRAARARLPHFIVDQNRGPGFTHTTIGAAIAAARPGEFILVRSAYYPEVVSLDGKGLVLQGEIGGLFDNYPLVDRIEVRDLGPRQAASLRGFRINEIHDPTSFELTNAMGPVWLEEIELPPGFSACGGRIENCEAVVLRRCSLELLIGKGAGPAPAGLSVSGSTVALYECSFRGANGYDLEDPGGPGLAIDGSVITLYASTSEGGVGFPCALGFRAGAGGPGVRINGGGTLDLIGSTVAGGDGGAGGSCTGGNPGPAFDIVFGTVNPLPNEARVLSVISPARPGIPTPLTLAGVPGDVAYLLLGTQPSTFSSQGASIGPIVVPPGSTLVHLGTLPAGGVLSTSYTFPFPSLVDSYYVQGVFINSALPEVAIGTATQVNVLAPSF